MKNSLLRGSVREASVFVEDAQVADVADVASSASVISGMFVERSNASKSVKKASHVFDDDVGIMQEEERAGSVRRVGAEPAACISARAGTEADGVHTYGGPMARRAP
jgi:hypothetical protein